MIDDNCHQLYSTHVSTHVILVFIHDMIIRVPNHIQRLDNSFPVTLEDSFIELFYNSIFNGDAVENHFMKGTEASE